MVTKDAVPTLKNNYIHFDQVILCAFKLNKCVTVFMGYNISLDLWTLRINTMVHGGMKYSTIPEDIWEAQVPRIGLFHRNRKPYIYLHKVSFIVVPLGSDTFLPMFIKFLKTFLETIFSLCLSVLQLLLQ
jgi:hypothetical protein